MKTLKKYLFVLLLLLIFTACNKKQDYTDYVSGKTFYNTVDEFNNNEHSKIWFGKDGTFVLTDNFFDGINEMSGDWVVNENVCILTVKQTGIGNISNIIFEIQDEDTIILKTTLAGSKAEDIFSTTKTNGNGNSNSNNNTGNNKNDNNVPLTTDIYYCCSNVNNNKSYFLLNSDNSATFVDRNDFSITEGNCQYEISGNYLIFKNFSPMNPFGKDITFMKDGEGVYVLQNDVSISATGDVFALNNQCPLVPESIIWENNYHNTIWVHETIADVLAEYHPTISFMNIQGKGNSFVFVENNYSGMAQITGSFTADDRYIICNIEDNSQMFGFAGYDVKFIEFEVLDSHTIKLLTDINMSRAGDLFILE